MTVVAKTMAVVWDGDVLVAETHDYGVDGIIEYEFSSALLIA